MDAVDPGCLQPLAHAALCGGARQDTLVEEGRGHLMAPAAPVRRARSCCMVVTIAETTLSVWCRMVGRCDVTAAPSQSASP